MTDYRVKILMAVYDGEADLAKTAPMTTAWSTSVYERGEDRITVEFHRYPIYGVYARAGFELRPGDTPGEMNLPYPSHGQPIVDGVPLCPPYHPDQVDNVTPAPAPILARQQEELAQLGREFDIIYWEHFRHCYPEVARHLKTWFKHSISHFADDCPSSARSKTNPVAGCFNSALHFNLIFDRTTGQSTRDYYKSQGVENVYYGGLGTSGGFTEGLADLGFSIDRKIEALRAGVRAPIDLVFVGPNAGPERDALAHAIDSFRAAGLNVRFHGRGMPDGLVHPRKGCGRPLAAIYAEAFAGVIPAWYGLVGTRLWDYWAAGVLSFMYDPQGELCLIGVRPGEHYIEYDGTPAGLLRSIIDLRERPQDAALVVAAGRDKGRELMATYSITAALKDVLFARLGMWRRE